MKKVLLFLFAVAALAAGCSGAGESGLVETVSALETRSANQEEWISYQATQIGRQQMMINDLSTRVPGGEVNPGYPTPYVENGVTGSVLIHDGACCMGSTAGDTISVDVAFDARSGSGEVVEMRVMVGSAKVSQEDFAEIGWEPFIEAREYPVFVPSNWSSFWVHVQYRDSNGETSEIYSDDIAIEGMPPMPTMTPGG